MRRLALLTLIPLVCAACASAPPAEAPPAPAPAAMAAPQDAESYMADIAKAPGVMVTASGLAYQVVKSGPASGVPPTLGQQVTVDYVGKLTNGQVFDSSAANGGPAVFTVGQLVQGWNEALQLMRPGDEWTLYVPPALGYGEEDKGPIPAHSVMVFRMKLLAVSPAG